jgi:16S rRNA (adenine1518-N6/adenine1519-N6)-dimethyltransferase
MTIEYDNVTLDPQKSLGQNFLTDDNISQKIADALNVSETDSVIEIGCGFGAITKHIARRTQRFAAIELDTRLADYARRTYGIQVINKNILDVPLASVFEDATRMKVIGNLPYAITSEIIFKILDEKRIVSTFVFMIQHEVAERLTAKPRTKAYGILSVQLQALAQPEILFKVSRNVFRPKPDVDSAVVRLTFKPDLSFDEAFFRTLVRTAFGMRRKTLENNLKGKYPIEKVPFDFKRRAEELTPDEFIGLAQAFAIINHQS